MKTFFQTIDDRYIPLDQIIEIKMETDVAGEKATLIKLKFNYNIDFYIVMRDGTTAAVSVEYMFANTMFYQDYHSAPHLRVVISHWANYRENMATSK